MKKKQSYDKEGQGSEPVKRAFAKLQKRQRERARRQRVRDLYGKIAKALGINQDENYLDALHILNVALVAIKMHVAIPPPRAPNLGSLLLSREERMEGNYIRGDPQSATFNSAPMWMSEVNENETVNAVLSEHELEAPVLQDRSRLLKRQYGSCDGVARYDGYSQVAAAAAATPVAPVAPQRRRISPKTSLGGDGFKAGHVSVSGTNATWNSTISFDNFALPAKSFDRSSQYLAAISNQHEAI